MGLLVSKSKQSDCKENKKFVPCVGYTKLPNLDETDDENDSANMETVNKISAKTAAISLTGPGTNNRTADNQETDLMCVGDAMFVGIDPREKEQPETSNLGRSKSLSMTTQVSPKTQQIATTDGDMSLQEQSGDMRPQEPDGNPFRLNDSLLSRRAANAGDLGAISCGRLGDRSKIRKELEEQGLLTDFDTPSNTESIMGELRGVGIIPEVNAGASGSTEHSFTTSGDTRRRLPPRLTHLPATQTTLPDRLRELKFGVRREADEKIPDVKVAPDNGGERIEPKCEKNPLLMKMINLETV